MAGRHEEHVGRVAALALQPVALKFSIAFEVTDNRLNGASPAQVSLDGGRGQSARLGDVDVRGLEAVAAVALVHEDPLNLDPGEPFDLIDLLSH